MVKSHPKNNFYMLNFLRQNQVKEVQSKLNILTHLRI